jgi:hypothetical protein
MAIKSAGDFLSVRLEDKLGFSVADDGDGDDAEREKKQRQRDSDLPPVKQKAGSATQPAADISGFSNRREGAISRGGAVVAIDMVYVYVLVISSAGTSVRWRTLGFGFGRWDFGKAMTGERGGVSSHQPSFRSRRGSRDRRTGSRMIFAMARPCRADWQRVCPPCSGFAYFRADFAQMDAEAGNVRPISRQSLFLTLCRRC